MMCRNITWTLLLGAALLVGCGKQIPTDVIQPDRMENILYDYHLSISMSNNLSYSDNYQKEAYKNYVFRKYSITEAEFDSSMVWYTRHTEELAAIYKRLGERFRKEKKQVQTLLAQRENKPATSQPGDTVNVWYDRTIYWLTDTPLTDKVTFEIPADSNFKTKDAFLWSADYTFLSDAGRKATVGFNIMFDNDSVVGRVQEVIRSGIQSLYIKPDSAFAIKSVNGFIYYEDDSLRTPGLIVNNITLTRYHEPVDSVAVAAKDSVAAAVKVSEDNVAADKKVDTVQVEPKKDVPVRMNPREMKENNAERPQRIKRRNKSGADL